MAFKLRRTLMAVGSLSVLAVGHSLWRYLDWHRTRREQQSLGRIGRLESRWLRINGTRMHARISVEPVPPGRSPVVLVHGLGMSSRHMLPIAEWLALDFPVHAPDLPGFGRSDKPRHVLTI